MSEKRRARLCTAFRILLLATVCFIWGNSLLSREDSAAFSGETANWLRRLGIPLEDDTILRKLAHFVEFGLLGCELSALLRLRGLKGLQNVCYSALAAFFIAAADETIQIFSGRGALLSDVLLDFTGAITGIVVLNLLMNRIVKAYRSRL